MSGEIQLTQGQIDAMWDWATKVIIHSLNFLLLFLNTNQKQTVFTQTLYAMFIITCFSSEQKLQSRKVISFSFFPDKTKNEINFPSRLTWVGNNRLHLFPFLKDKMRRIFSEYSTAEQALC